jgi:RNA polymerase sigma-70 factor, ECF subfamily
MERVPQSELQNYLTRLAGGDRSALHPAFEALWSILRRFTRRQLPEAEAEDAAQEVLVKIFRQAGQFDPSRSAVAWVLGVVVLARDLEQVLGEALGTLKAEDLETLRLYARGERPDLPGATFRKRVERALSRLRHAWRANDERL